MQTLSLKDHSGNPVPVRPPWGYLRLPPFPQVAIRVLQLTNNENVQLHQLSELISSDAAFATEVLTIANSIVYAPRYPAQTILHAIAVLGANNLQGMCLTVGVRSFLGRALKHPVIRELWRHNLACAILSEQIAAAGFMDKDTAYTAGILHDIGRLALAVLRPSDYTALLNKHSGTGADILTLETALFGCNHCEAGSHLVRDWRLPREFDPIVADHHSARRHDGAWSMAELIKVSCRLADAVGFKAFAGCDVTPFDELMQELPSRERSGFQSSLDTLVADVRARIEAVEAL
jgi:putative nucleotidyltransferase with HDIG domain